MKLLIKVIDALCIWSGKIGRWAAVALVLSLSYEVISRHVFNAPTIWAHDTSSMLGGTIAALGWSYTHQRQGHVRVDVFYSRLSQRNKALVDVLGTLLFFLPLMIILARTAYIRLIFSWSMHERLSMSFWYPPAAPIRTVVFIGLSLFALQGLAQLIRDFNSLIRGKPYA